MSGCESWPIVWPCDTPVPQLGDDRMQAAAISGAQALLWARTGRRLGLCEVTENYSLPPGGGPCGRPYMTDDLVWHNNGSGQGGACCALHLVNTPIQSVTAVSVFGVPLIAGSWAVHGAQLVRVGQCWPRTFECDQAPIQVVYTWGVPIQSNLWGLVSAAMGEVAMELLQGMCGGVCRLPSRATSVTRQGVSVTMGSPQEYVSAGLVGLPIADSLIETVNPGLPGRFPSRHQARSRVYSPDMARMSKPVMTLPGAVNVGGVSTLTLPDAYQGDNYEWTLTLPDATYLIASPGDVQADIKATPTGSVLASFVRTVEAGNVLRLALTPVLLAPGRYVTDVSIGGVTYVKKTEFVVRAQVSNG